MKKVRLVIFFLILSKSITAQTFLRWDDLVNHAISKREILFNNDRKTVIQLLHNDSLYIKYNNFRLLPVEPTGRKIKDDSMLFIKEMAKGFMFKENQYVYLPAQLTNCLGSFCRASIGYLLVKKKSSFEVFKFISKEVPEIFLFGDVNGDNKLDALEIHNSFNDSKEFTKEELKIVSDEPDKTIYKIYAMSLVDGKWHRLKQSNQFSYILLLKDVDSDTLKIIRSSWPKDLK